MKKLLFTTLFTSVLFLSAFSYAHADITTGLVGHWKFDDGSGTTAVDSSGNNNTGTLTNGPTWTTGKIDGALEFDGVDDYVDIGNGSSLNLTQEITLSAWVKFDDTSTLNVLIGKYDGASDVNDSYYLAVDNGIARINIRNSIGSDWYAANCTGSVSSNTWYHIAGTFDGTNTICYLDTLAGVPTASVDTIRSNSTKNVTIGAATNGLKWRVNGQIDDVRIYNRALSQAGVTELYSIDSGTVSSPPSTPTTCTLFTYSDWQPATCPINEIQTRITISSSPSGCTGGTQNLTQSCIYTSTLDTIPLPTQTNSWQSILDANFDIAESFNELQNWVGRPLNGRDTNKAYLPKRSDGSDSMWDFYDYWSSNSSSEPTWIGNHGVDNVWGGTGKSLRMHVGGLNKKGPSRFGLYFGTPNGGSPDAYSASGSADSGYDEIYIFYMLKYHSNAFPKKINGDYDYIAYYKFNVLASGFLSIGNPVSGSTTYGPSNGHPHISVCSSYCGPNATDSISIRQRYKISGTGASDNYYWTQDGSFNSYLENSKWFGVEFYYSRGTPGQNDGKMKIWLYNEQGNEKQVLDVTQNMMPAGANYKYNKFFFGGNLSFGDEISTQGLDTAYYVDDFIIDNQRIGPTYFSLFGGDISSTTPTLLGDFNQDGTVNSLDWSIMNSAWGTSNTQADLNNDGIVNSIDFSILNREWGI